MDKKQLKAALQDNPDLIIQAAARKRLVNFARYVNPDLQLEPFHKVYYELLNRFAHGEIKRMIVQMPPQHGKSLGSSRLLPAFLLGINPNVKIGVGSYAATIAEGFNRDVQRIIDTAEYVNVFPNTLLNSSNVVTVSSSYLRNSTEFEIVGKKGGLRAVGRGGALTSRSIDVMIMDDVYKDYAEGNSPVIRDSAWDWYTSVVRTRLDNKGRELIVFTRWNEDDLIGRIEKSGEEVIEIKSWEDLEKASKTAWIKINFEAIKESEPTELDQRQRGEALWEDKHSAEKLTRDRALDPVKFQCLHQGNPGSSEGRLYSAFKIYVNKEDFGKYVRSGNYTDVADEGKDFLFSACYDIYISDNQVYNEKTKRFEPLIFALITDMVFTDANTDVTTVTVPRMINANGTQKAWIESNGGGAQFEKIIKTKIKALTVPFHQGGNKESRIITASAVVNSQIIFPFGWEERFNNVYEHLTTFLRDFKANRFDDVADGLTGIAEKEILSGNTKAYNAQNRGVKRRN